jgi:hypothetical protein
VKSDNDVFTDIWATLAARDVRMLFDRARDDGHPLIPTEYDVAAWCGVVGLNVKLSLRITAGAVEERGRWIGDVHEMKFAMKMLVAQTAARFVLRFKGEGTP